MGLFTSAWHLTGKTQLSPEATRELSNVRELSQLMAAAQSGQHAQALKLYGALPAELRQSKFALLGRLMALIHGDETLYVKALEEYSSRFPDDARLGLFLLDIAFLRKDSKLLKKAYDSLQGWSGGDPLMTLMVASIRAGWGEKEEALRLAGQVDVSALGVSLAHDLSLSLALAIKDHKRALTDLRALRDRYNYEFNDLSTVEGYQHFAASAEYQQLLSDGNKR